MLNFPKLKDYDYEGLNTKLRQNGINPIDWVSFIKLAENIDDYMWSTLSQKEIKKAFAFYKKIVSHMVEQNWLADKGEETLDPKCMIYLVDSISEGEIDFEDVHLKLKERTNGSRLTHGGMHFVLGQMVGPEKVEITMKVLTELGFIQIDPMSRSWIIK